MKYFVGMCGELWNKYGNVKHQLRRVYVKVLQMIQWFHVRFFTSNFQSLPSEMYATMFRDYIFEVDICHIVYKI